MTTEHIQGLLGLFVLIFIGVLPALFMWISLLRQGDERRKMILEKSCTFTLAVYTFTMLIDLIGSAFNAEIFDPLQSNLNHLGVIGVLFAITLFFTKRKYGN